jgi:antirestriction protein ArdC
MPGARGVSIIVKSKATHPEKAHVFEQITAQVIEAMQRDDIAPWQRPWSVSGTGGGLPRNAVSGKPYRGINVIALVATSWAKGYTDAQWLTFKQARDLGGHVRKGEKGTQIVFWKILEREVEGKASKFPMARTYTVFNVQQCEGLPAAETVDAAPVDPEALNVKAEAIIASPICPIVHGGDVACYVPSMDTIRMPLRAAFVNAASYYSVAFHELGHATGHTSRIGRTFGTNFGDHKYSREELVAEFCACMVAATCGVERAPVENSAAYLKVWAAKLAEDPRMLVDAAQAAQKAADLILGHAAARSEDSDDEAAMAA